MFTPRCRVLCGSRFDRFAIVMAGHQLVAYVQMKKKAYHLQPFGACPPPAFPTLEPTPARRQTNL